jgi:hypothetical protein
LTSAHDSLSQRLLIERGEPRQAPCVKRFSQRGN